MITQQLSIIPTSYPVRDLQRKYTDILDFIKIHKAPALLINKSKPEAVILDIETYNNLVTDNYEYDEDYVLALDKQAMAEHRAGKTKKLRSLQDLL
ncbi:MAG: hypothetical protein WC801_00920 [Patescibacteria group bacterium]|jgi:PHD/YefM family antitoxin component YafN of YafNO toxin-antitoxin module